MSKKEKLKIGEVLNIFNKLNTTEILKIRDTEFAKGVVKNMTAFIPLVEKSNEYKQGSDEWVELIKDVQTQDELTELRENKDNDKLFDARDLEIEEYKAWLESDYDGELTMLKINNLNTELSAEDLLILQSIVKA